VLVLKAPRRLLLLRGGRVVRDYQVALGKNPEGRSGTTSTRARPKADTRSTGESPTAASTAHCTFRTRTSAIASSRAARASRRATA